MSQAFLTSGNSGEPLGHIRYRNIISNSHKKSLEDGSELFDFSTHAGKDFSKFIEGNNRVIIPGEDGDFLEFIIYEVQEDRIERRLEVYSYASYAELTKAKVIAPHTTQALSAEVHGNQALAGTGWQIRNAAFKGTRTLTFDNYTNPYAYLKKIKAAFGLELDFVIDHKNGDIVGRYVDMVDRVGKWRGRRVEFGKDLMGLRRIENTEQIVTALKVIGPEQEDGTRLEVVVEDKDALQRWGHKGKHIIKEYEPQFVFDETVNEARLRELGEQELAKRVKAIVTYEGTIADLENVPGLENKKIRFGDTIQIKDTSYEPALYLDARIFYQDRDIKAKDQKQIRLGDFTEYTAEEVNAVWKSLQKQINLKPSMSDVKEVTYTKQEVDNKDDIVFTEGKNFAEAVGIDAKSHADNVSLAAETNAKNYAEDKSTEALQQAQAYAVAQTVYDNKMSEIATDLADKADLIYVDGQLVSKANKNDVYTISEIDNALLNKVSVTEYQTDMDGIVQDISVNSTLIGQNQTAIALKANQTDVDTLSGMVSDNSAQLTVQANQISSKVDASTFNTLKGRVDTAESTITQQANEIDLKVNENGVIAAINLTSEVATINASKINLVGAVTVLSDITGNLGTINAGTINGVNINGSAFKQTGTNGTISIDDRGLIFKGTSNSIEMDIIQTSGYHGDIASLVFKDNSGLRAMEIYQYYTDCVIESDRGLLLKASDQGLYLDGTAMYNAFNVPGVEIGGGLKVDGNIYSDNGIFGNVRGTMRHDSGYFTVFPYATSYDDGTHARFFYAGSGNSSYAGRSLHFMTSSGGLKLSAAGFNQTSRLENKTNIVPFDKSVLDDYRHNLDLYTFDYVDNGIGLQNNIGFVIGDGYKAPKEIMDVEEKSASLYNFISYNAKAIKEVVSIYDDHEMRINTLADRINYLEMENQVLKQRLKQLEGVA